MGKPNPTLQKIFETRDWPVDLVRRSIEERIEQLIYLLDVVDGDPDLEPELGWTMPAMGCLPGEPTDDREGNDERDCDLAGGTSDIEDDRAHNDDPGFIWGGNEPGGPAHSGA